METGERVYVVPTEDLFGREGPFRGFRAEGLRRFLEVIGERGRFRDRAAAEGDPGTKQIIPYAVICAGNRVLLLRRKTAQTEIRLHRKVSIGVGGHLNPSEEGDGTRGIPPLERALRVLEAGLRRELEEEIVLPEGAWAEPVGCLNDDGNAVGRVHFAIVYRVWSPPEGVRIREVDLMEGRLVARSVLRAHAASMETWSELLVAAVLGWPTAPQGPAPARSEMGVAVVASLFNTVS